MRSKVLITGVAGLIGSHLAKALLERGHDVVGVDDFSLGVGANIEPYLGHERFRFCQDSILNPTKMNEACEGASVIFHLAAQKIPRYGGYLRTLDVNVKGTEIMLECARRTSARMIFASTDDVYGKGSDASFTEESPLVLGESRVHRWGAAASKIYGEHLCFAYAEKYGLSVAIIRYSGVYGPVHHLSKLSGAQDLFIAAALSDRPIPIHGDGNQTRPFTYISDVIEATLKVFETPYADSEILNVGSAAQISIVNLAYLIWRLAGAQKRPELRFVPYTDFSRLYEDPLQRRVDSSKANYLLGYRPRVDLEEGMQLQVQWFRNNLENIRAVNPEFFQEVENSQT